MQLKPYPEYKESGQPLLGKIPAHWDLFRNGRLFSQRNETGFGDLPILEVSLKTGVRVRDMDNLKRKQVMADREKYKRAAQGDIAYNMMRMWQGAIGVAPVDGLVSPAYVVVKPFPEVDCRYFSYLFRTTVYMNEVDAYSRGIVKDRNRLYWQDFKRMPSVVPPFAEQRQIVHFLNDAGGKIHRFIRNKRRLIELLKEQKQNIINQAVTRGVDPNVKLKPSGVEWIGDIPEHWEAGQLKRYLLRNDGGVWGSGFSEDGVIVFRSTEQTVDGQWRATDPARRILTEAERIGSTLEAGDLLVTKSSGSPAHIGKTTLVTDEVAALSPCFSNFMQRLRLKQSVEPEYLWLYMNSRTARTQLQYLSNSTTGLGNLSESIIGRIIAFLPAKPEQVTILSGLKNDMAPIDAAIQKAEKEIELMREYRDRLIADVVTGQVDVRGIDVPKTVEEAFPETADELDVVDDLDDEATGDEV